MFTENELKEMTVLQLRKTAKENGIVIGAGVDKAGIIRKILENTAESEPETVQSAPAEPKYQSAWHNTDAPRFSSRPSYQAPMAGNRPAWQNTSPSGHQFTREPRVQPVRSAGYTPRFGPAPSAPVSAPAGESEQPPAQNEENPRPAMSPLPSHRISETAGYTHRISVPYQPGNLYTSVPENSSFVQQQEGAGTPTL